MWNLNTKKTGYKALVPDYQKVILQKLFTIEGTINSGEMHNYLIDTMNELHPSRASVINFLNALADNNYIEYKEVTGKGGHHRRYYIELTKIEFVNQVSTEISTALSIALSEILLL